MVKKKKNGNGKKKPVDKKNCPSCYGEGKVPLEVYGGSLTWAGVAWIICDVCNTT